MKKTSTLLLIVTTLFINSAAFSQALKAELSDDQKAAALQNPGKQQSVATSQNLNKPFVMDRQSLACDTITTLFASNNGLDGAMFDVVANTSITINSLTSNLSADGDFNIYYKNGSYMGFENDSTAWTLAGSASVIANPVDTPTIIPIALSLTVNTGDTMGLYLVCTGSASVKYTNALSGVEGDVYTDNGDLAILIGAGVTYPFDFVIGPRVWNGIIDYCTDATGINELNNSAVVVYPNPFNESATFTFQDSQERTIEIFNSTGTLVKKVSVENPVFKLLKEDLANGIYTYRISSEGKTQSGRVIIN